MSEKILVEEIEASLGERLRSTRPMGGGPPPHIAADVKRVRAGGMALMLLSLIILFLMVFKPQI